MKVEWVPVGDVLELRRRSVDVDLREVYQEIGVRAHGRGLFIKQPASGADLGNKRVFTVKRDDLVVSNVFAWEGAVATAGSDHDGLIGSHRFMTWSPSSAGQIDVPYVAHYFASDRGVAALAGASPGSAGRNRTLSVKNLTRLQIPLPPLPDQRRIAAHLDHVASSSAITKHASAEVEVRVRAVRNQMLSAQGTNSVRVGDVTVQAQHAVPVDPDEVYRTLGIKNRGRGVFPRPGVRGDETKYKTYFRVRSGQLVFSKLFAWEGSVAIVPERFDGYHVSPEFPTFDVDPTRVVPEYLHQVIRSDQFFTALAGATTGMGQRRQRVNPTQFSQLLIPLPDRVEQERTARLLATAERAGELATRRIPVAAALLPAARNDIFNAMR